MGIQRSQSEMFDASFAEVLKTVRAVLANGQTSYRYDQTAESGGGREFTTVIKPYSAGMASTNVRINLYTFESQTKVRAEINSPWYVWGDKLDFYGSYLREFLGSVRSGIGHEITSIPSTVQEQAQVPMKLFLFVNFTAIVLLVGDRFIVNFLFGEAPTPVTRQSVEHLVFLSQARVILLAGTILLMTGFNYWWRKKYYHVLDPRVQASMNHGRNSGRRIAIVMGAASILFFAYRFLLRP